MVDASAHENGSRTMTFSEKNSLSFLKQILFSVSDGTAHGTEVRLILTNSHNSEASIVNLRTQLDDKQVNRLLVRNR